jgi:ABC-type spermidine/putrescine transport system permease subunit II
MGRWFAATWIHGLAAAAQVSMILSIGWMSGRGNYEEQGALDAGPWRVFWHISLHRMLPFVGVAVFWVMAVCSREIAVTDIYQIGTLAEHIYLGYALGQSDQLLAIWPDGDTGIGYGVHVVTIAWFGVGAWLLFDFWCEVEPDLQPHRKQESSRLTVGSWAAWVSIVIVLMVPLATLLLRTSMTVERVDGQPTQVFRLAQAAHAFVRVWSDYRTELVWSSLIGVVGSVVSLALALWLAGLWMTRPLWKGVLGLSIAVTLCIPGPLLGTWLLQISQIATHRLAIWLFDRTIFAPALASMIFVWPLIALVVWQWVRQTNREQLQQSALEGAGQFRQLTSIILGGRSKGVFGLMLIAFALCFSELSAAQMVVPAGIDTVPRLTLGLLHAGVDEMASAISLVAALVISAVALIGLAFFGRRD